jgi:gluconokinase
MSAPKAYVVMGVSGCGKSTVARFLADRVGGEFRDADDFHPPANKAKMAAGIPLTDDDRWGWLDTLNAELRTLTTSGRDVFLACSALRQVYRDRLSSSLPFLRFIYLQGSKECIRQRIESREGHFMPAALLDSQFATLEEPTDAIVVSVEMPLPEMIVQLETLVRAGA